MAKMQRHRIFVFDDLPLAQEGGGEDDVDHQIKHWKHLLASVETGRAFQWAELSPEAAQTTEAGLLFSSGYVDEMFRLMTYKRTHIMQDHGLAKSSQNFALRVDC